MAEEKKETETTNTSSSTTTNDKPADNNTSKKEETKKKEDTKKKEEKKEAKTEEKSTPTKSDEELRQETLKKYQINDKVYSGRYRAVREGLSKDDAKKDSSGSEELHRGFYYDAQLENPYLSMSLHANTKIVNGKWVKWPGPHLEPISESRDYSKCYGAQPIARCIISEDFSYSITNNFSDYNGGNPIESMFENFKPYAPIYGKFGKAMKEGAASNNANGNYGSSIISMISSAAGKIGDWMSKSSSYLNKALFVQGSRFSFYNGTSFNFNNMEMKFIAFSDYVTKDGGKTWVFQSVEDYIKTLQPYVMGIYSRYNADFLSQFDSTIAEEARKFISEYVGFQDPPGGFTMDTKALDNTLLGTVRLNIGGTWAIENLVIRGINVNMSRVQAKHPEYPGQTVPLYAEISIQLAPAAALVDTGYRDILDHKGMSRLRTNLESRYNTDLENQIRSYIKKENEQ